jgi:hypothetical protein
VKKEFIQLPKAEAIKVTNLQQFEAAFLNFFTCGSLRRDVIEECLKKILALQQWMAVQVHYKFVASSLLFVFDGTSSPFLVFIVLLLVGVIFFFFFLETDYYRIFPSVPM